MNGALFLFPEACSLKPAACQKSGRKQILITEHLYSNLLAMTTANTTSANRGKIAEAAAIWQRVLDETLQRGFYGSAHVEISVQDGTIQQIRRRVEQVAR